ncbi:alpha/beta hydrolase [Bradyrhizobium japonicum]|uniref:Alpha/beta hydrolase n=1 Tax=Bradyrhizobium japonicum TaxID=375 RepID=A0A0A3Z4X4_BRAJP|nr:alpha/beta fold hydrolase [Bradyrhizobium japonicum]KGT80918.1 alpha/beta hydrolase [Bradyrhizobium japonicum]MCS3892759.1 pimeloyl-ACP methyl ester carboxylesterase [Bradyrhizobium japonicum USDA 38]MCS3945272.1 pimeloyl-ACP methyl ester carboxylesterase [Bradyrhizobium japonicum]MCW2222201.1 pimeloyl-ACP methyl ester carboxylesterase [Bradyrhizobium japonicum]MCW2346813.1 pimeloyl-ACP methyl ester carboxylesterase [Bradyrhizobium japonicum]
MAIRLLRGVLHGLKWALCAVGAVALILAAMIATPLERPPEMRSVSESVKLVDFSTMPPLERFQARDGTWIGYRHYAPNGPATGRGAIFIHGSSGSSGTVNHALTHAIAARGVETWALDMRGHGGSGTRGDIGYVGQLEDDLVDFVAHVRKGAPDLPLTLIGHSAGAGFSLRLAATPIMQDMFVRTVLLAPYLGYDAPTNRPSNGGWVSADIPRFLGLTALRKLGIECCAQLPVLAFAVPANSERILTPTYSDRLMRNFATRGYRLDLPNVTHPMTIFGGAQDEMMISDKYAETVQAIKPSVDVKLIEGVNHMGMVTNPKAVNAIAEDVATRGAGQS